MGGSCSGGDAGTKEEADRSRAIDRALKETKKELEHEVKLLLLGAGESGKSTVAKQMKILYLKGFTEAERKPFREIIFSNLIMSMRALVLAVEKFGESVAEENKERARLFKSNTILFEQNLTPEIVSAIQHLWKDPAVKTIYERNNEFQINDSTDYFFNDLERISAPDYLPNETDILRSRARTTGITEISFYVDNIHFRMVDVGGQRSERKKWIHCFQDVTGLIFCVALSEYDMKLYEDETVNRMHESIMLFDEICNCTWFNDTSVILFLNKQDLFREKIKKVDLSVCFPDYTGGCDYTRAADYISQKFAALNRNVDKQIYAHITQATNTANIGFVFGVVREIVMRESLRSSGVL